MFDCEFILEEFPIQIDGKPVAAVNGSAQLEHDPGYGFVVTSITLETLDGEGVVRLHSRCIDPEMVRWFHELAEAIVENEAAREHFAHELDEYRRAA